MARKHKYRAPTKRAGQSAENTVQNTARMRPGRNGGMLRSGNPGNKGGTGRPPDYMYQRAAELATDPTAWDKQLERARDGDLKALLFAKETAFGKAKESVEISGPDGGPIEQVMIFGTRRIVF